MKHALRTLFFLLLTLVEYCYTAGLINVVGGSENVFFINAEGKVFISGERFGGLNVGAVAHESIHPRLLTGIERVKHICISDSGENYFLSFSGEISVFKIKLVQGSPKAVDVKRIDLPAGVKALKMQCSSSEMTVLTTNHDVFTREILSHGSKGSEVRAMEQKVLPSIRDIACGSFHCIALSISDKDTYYAWGSNEYGQLGTVAPNADLTGSDIQSMKFHANINKVVCGKYHTLILTETEELFGMGDNTYGQIGNNRELDGGYRYISSNVNDMTSGIYHTLIKKKFAMEGFSLPGSHKANVDYYTHHIYGIGLNKDGQLGDGTTENRAVLSESLMLIKSDDIQLMEPSTTSRSSFVITTTHLYATGHNDANQLGFLTSSPHLNSFTKIPFFDQKETVHMDLNLSHESDPMDLQDQFETENSISLSPRKDFSKLYSVVGAVSLDAIPSPSRSPYISESETEMNVFEIDTDIPASFNNGRNSFLKRMEKLDRVERRGASLQDIRKMFVKKVEERNKEIESKKEKLFPGGYLKKSKIDDEEVFAMDDEYYFNEKLNELTVVNYNEGRTQVYPQLIRRASISDLKKAGEEAELRIGRTTSLPSLEHIDAQESLDALPVVKLMKEERKKQQSQKKMEEMFDLEEGMSSKERKRSISKGKENRISNINEGSYAYDADTESVFQNINSLDEKVSKARRYRRRSHNVMNSEKQ